MADILIAFPSSPWRPSASHGAVVFPGSEAHRGPVGSSWGATASRQIGWRLSVQLHKMPMSSITDGVVSSGWPSPLESQRHKRRDCP